MSLAGKTALITGASRGIGAEIAKALVARGANVAVAAKSAEPHKTLPGTIHTVVDELHEIAERNRTGAKALALQLDVRDAGAVEDVVNRVASHFRSLDMVVNNASAINLGPTAAAAPKTYDLINNINARGTWLTSRYALPHLFASAQAQRNPHLLTLSPPLDQGMFARENGEIMRSFADTKALYAMSKCAMSVAAYAFAAECQAKGVASNALWPYTLIGTSAMRIVNPGEGAEKHWRSPEIMADAAVRILAEPATFTGHFLIDELYLRQAHGFTNDDLNRYAVVPGTPFAELTEDLFISQEVRSAIQAYYA
ncbi:hypothetical protein MBRA1_003357 [Malassezia brasiliensis]|uniref:Uncharacterized protein n=1 Tax=Malassezia brasiliensis TaxID=1821822 RepID=A0AAF0DVU3_9BASI|nr:hypothetical protein MBRA1_003357 [Malassezia brasiliensis]